MSETEDFGLVCPRIDMWGIAARLLVFLFFGLLSGLQAMDVHRQSPRSLGAGSAYVAVADDESAFFQNSAGISRNLEQRRLSARASAMSRVRDFDFSASVIDAKTENPLSWGFDFNWARTRDEWFQDFALATAFNYRNFIMVGSQSKFTNFNTAAVTKDYWLFSVDFGALAFLGDFISLGVNAKNLIRTKLEGAPILFIGGLAFNHRVFRVSLDAERNFTADINSLRTGLEVQPVNSVVLRGGFLYSRRSGKDEKSYTLGLSLNLLKKLSLDAGFLDRLESEFKSTSAGLSFIF